MKLLPKLSFQKRAVVAFLLVPWLPVLFFVPLVPYAPNLQKFRLFGWEDLYALAGLGLVFATFTYLLEVTVLIPIWRSMLRAGHTSLLKIITVVFVVALATILITLSLLTGTEFMFDKSMAWPITLFCLVGCTEAFVFWLIVRPDKYVRPDRAMPPSKRTDGAA